MNEACSAETCRDCGASVAASGGPVHAYLGASAGCWALFGLVQADELTRFRYPPAHRLVVDAYAAQHPGDPADRRARQSVFVHLVGLCVLLERGGDARQATEALRRATAGRPSFPALRREGGPGVVTIVSMVGARDLEEYGVRARRFAESVWASWQTHHPRIRAFLSPRPSP